MAWRRAHRLVALAALVAACGRSETPPAAEPASLRAAADAAPRRSSPPPETPTPAALDALLADLRSKDDAVRAKAGASITTSGPAAVDALFEWMTIVARDDDRPEIAVTLLAQFGHAAVPGAVRLLGHADAEVGFQAIRLLNIVDKFWIRADDGPDVAKALFRLWDDPDERVRDYARGSLRDDAPAAGCLASALADRIDPKNVDETKAVVELLGRLGDDASAVAPRIAELLSNDDLADAAENALSRLGPSAAPALARLVDFMERGTRDEAARALCVLQYWDDAAVPAVPTLIKRLADENPTLRGVAALVLGRCGAAGPEVVDALARAFAGADEERRNSVVMALSVVANRCPARHDDVARVLVAGARDLRIALLGEISGYQSDRVPWPREFAACLRDPDVSVRRAAMSALESVDAPDRSVIDACAAATSDADPVVRLVAVRAVHGWDAKALKSPTDVVAPLLSSENPEVRVYALSTLSALAPDVARFRAALRDPDKDVRDVAAMALGKMGPAASDAAADLASALADPASSTAAAVSLRQIGVADDAVVGALAKALSPGTHGMDRTNVLFALSRLGPVAAAAVPAVKALVEDDDSGVRNAAVQTLLAINPDRAAAVESVLATTDSPEDQIRALGVLGADGAGGILRAASRDAASGASHARDALKDLGDAASSAVRDATRAPDAALRTVAVGCLDLVDRATALAVLDVACVDADPRVRAAAAETAVRLADAGADVTPLAGRLVAMLSDADVAARTSAARAVGRLGAAGVAGVPRLRALFADGPIPQRVAAGCAIHRLTREIDDLLPTFQALLRAPADDEVAVAWEDLARTVASIGPRASSLADAMGSALLRCDDAATQIATLDALATFGRAAVPALPAVRAAARAEVDSRRRNDGKGFQDLAIQTLAAMGPAAAAALPDLRVLARDPDCAKAVADAIRKITAAR